MRPLGVVIIDPAGEDRAGLTDREEQRLVEQLVAHATIKAVTWKGLRCVVEVESDAAGLSVDIRTKPALATSSLVANIKSLDSGKANLAVADDEHMGTAAVVVVLGPDGEVVQKQATTVGGN